VPLSPSTSGPTPVQPTQDSASQSWPKKLWNLITSISNPLPPPIRGDFSLFSNLPHELRVLIWKYSLPGPRIVKLQESRKFHRWIANCPPPTLLRVNRESRAVVLTYYKFCQVPHINVFLDPSIDTLYFGPTTSDRDFLDFIHHARSKDLRSLKNLAIHDMHLAAWSNYSLKHSDIPSSLFAVLEGLENFMIGVQLPREENVSLREAHPDHWEGWLFGGGLPTEEELFGPQDYDSHEQRYVAFSAIFWIGLLFHFAGAPNASPDTESFRYPESIAPSSMHPSERNYKLLKYFYSVNPGIKKGYPLQTFIFDLPKFYRTTRKVDFRVGRLFDMYQRVNLNAVERWTPLRVGCFVRIDSTFHTSHTWESCLQPLCDDEWSRDN